MCPCRRTPRTSLRTATMMSDAYQEFNLALSQVWSSGKPTIVGRPIGPAKAGLLIAADAKGQRHILAPLAQEQAFEQQVWDNLRLTEATFRNNRYLDLVCTSDGLAHVFAALADQVVRRVEQEDRLASEALQATLTEWRQLLKPAPALTEEQARGLFGELTVLKALAERSAGYALDAWTGPDMDLHDFTTPGGDIEVKTSKTEGLDITVSSLHQLDAPDGRPLVLARIHVESSPQGKNIGDMVDDLCRLGIIRDQLLEKLAAIRFILGSDPDANRFIVTTAPVAWLVDESFPGLRSSDIPEPRRTAIRRVSYALDLVAAGEPLTPSDFDSHIDRMMTACTA